jgi:hypothetical protein
MNPATVIGMAWSLTTGLAGGWLILSPWAFGEQPSGGSWTTVTQTAFFTGLGLVAMAVVGLIVVIVQAVSALRRAGAFSNGRPAARAGGREPAESPEFESALIALAQALAADLSSQQAATAASRPEGSQPRQSLRPGGEGPTGDHPPMSIRSLER